MTLPEAVPFEGRIYHATPPEGAGRAERDFDAFLRDSLESNEREGGRFNPPCEFGAVYFSLDARTPVRELQKVAERDGEPPKPTVVLEAEARFERVLDLRDPDAVKLWGLEPSDICGEDHGPCQRAARAIREGRYEAIRCASAAGEGENLVVYWDRRTPASELRLVGRAESAERQGAASRQRDDKTAPSS
jgi:RES domain-containing protein